MSCAPPCLPPKGQLYHFPGTGGPLLLIGEKVQTRRSYLLCPDPCARPKVPNGTVAFFEPRRIPLPPGPGPSPGPGPHPPAPGPGPGPEPPPPVDDVTIETEFVSAERNCELCGFNELASPSTPPKKYKERLVSGSLMKTNYPGSNCDMPFPAEGSTSFSGLIPDSGATFTCSISVSIIGETESTLTYIAFWQASTDQAAARMSVSGLGSFKPSGYVFTVNKGTFVEVDVEWNWIYWHGQCPGSCVRLIAQTPSFTDNWNSLEFYDSACNFYSSISAIRSYGTSYRNLSTFPALTNFVALGQPQFCYDPNVSVIVGPTEPVYITTSAPTQIQRVTTGLGCVTNPYGFGPPSIGAVGSITELLSSEDTEPMAIARATPIPGTSNVAKYEARAAFTFLYQTVDVNISITGLTPGQDYSVQIPIITEDYGGGSGVDSELTYGFNADATTKNFTYPVVAARGFQISVGTPTISSTSVTPTIVSTTISENGLTWTFVFLEAVQFGAGGNGGFVPTASGGAVTLAYASGNGTRTWTYTGSRAIQYNETVTLAYTQPGNGIKDISGAELASFSGQIVVNTSDIAGPPVLISATLGTNGTSWTLVFSEIVQVGAGGSAGFAATPTGGSVGLAYASGSGSTTLVYTGDRVVYDDENIALAYTQPGSGIERPGTGEDLASFTGTAVVNGSTQLLTLDAETIVWRDGVIEAAGDDAFEGNSVTIANNFINALQAKSYNAQVVGFWPLLGKGVNAALMPLRDTLGVGAALSYNFVNADFSQATGIQGDGFSKILDLLIKPSQLGTTNNGGLGYGEGDIDFTGTTTNVPMGCTNTGASQGFALVASAASKGFQWGAPTSYAESVVAATNGRYYGQRPSSILREMYFNGALVATDTTADTATGAADFNINMMGWDVDDSNGILCWNGRGTYGLVTNGTLSAPDAADLDALIVSHLLTPTGR